MARVPVHAFRTRLGLFSLRRNATSAPSRGFSGMNLPIGEVAPAFRSGSFLLSARGASQVSPVRRGWERDPTKTSQLNSTMIAILVPSRFTSGIKRHQTEFTVAPRGGIIMNSKEVVLITGSSTGFGRLFADTLARKGHTVFATMRDPGGRNAKNASEIRTLAEKDSLPIYVLEMDVTDDASVQRAVDAAVAKAGRIDVAINNAGYVVSGLAEAVTPEQAQRLMDTNFLGPVRVNRAVLPHMRRQRSGVLMHISSAAGRIIAPSMGFYCASKFALEALAEAYSYELAGQGIESVIVEPGQYETAVFGSAVTGADEARTDTYGAVKEIPAKVQAALSSSAGNAQEVADAVLRIIETPAGERQLRYFVSPQNFGVDEINALSKQVQANILAAFGLAADTKFRKGRAVGSV